MVQSQGQKRTAPRVVVRRGNVHRIGGVDVPWDPNIDVDKPKPTPLFPSYKVEKPHPLSEREKRQVWHLKSLRDRIHNGPLFAVLEDNSRNTRSAATFDSFNGMQKYSQRYAPKKRPIPKLDTRSYVLKHFPKELWPTLNPNYKEIGGSVEGTSKSKKLQNLDQRQLDGTGLGEQELSDDEGHEERLKDPDNEDNLLEDVDDDYDEDDEGGDYNAEQYFDGGGDDGEVDLDGGDEAGADFY